MTERLDLLTAEFMVTQLDGGMHSALSAEAGSGVAYKGMERKFVATSERIIQDESDDNDHETKRPCIEARDELLRIINKYRKKKELKPLETHSENSWSQLEEDVNNLCDEVSHLADKRKTPTSNLRRAVLWLCKHAGTGQNVSALLPNDSYNSVICGGMKIVFTGLRESWLHREEIYKAIEELPTILKDHAQADELFEKRIKYDKELKKRGTALYTAIFRLLSQILLWFTKNSFKLGVRAIVDPMNFSEDLRNRASEVKIAAQNFGQQVRHLSMRSIQNIEVGMEESLVMQQRVMRNLSEIKCMQERSLRVNVLQELNSLYQQTLFARLYTENCEMRAALDSHKQQMLYGITADDILDRFGFDADLVPNDCRDLQNLIQFRRRDDLDEARLKDIQSNSSLQAWQVTDESSLILLNGRSESRDQKEVSVSNAYRVDALFNMQAKSRDGTVTKKSAKGKKKEKREGEVKMHIIPLAFFCSQHPNCYVDSDATAEGLAMSLLLQLVHHHAQNFSSSTLNEIKEAINEDEDVSSICDALEIALSSLPRNVIVYMIIDGLNTYSRPHDRREGTIELVERLVAIHEEISKEKEGATLKFLFADSIRLSFLEDLFEQHQLIGVVRQLRTF